MKKITIETVANGYVVTVEKEYIQSFYNNNEAFIALDIDEVLKIVKENK